jgi:alkanesulfonate monooxygenase SsuD/methylene tetrahydromethanopterin reductase-like flavin-dependent oxidoreductase (luciferase family)
MMLSLRYDLRAPSFGAPAAELYAAAIEQSVWAEKNGFWMVALSEHHGSDDGYCPSPMMVASAIAARTSTLRMVIAALVLPLHDPVRVAEDLAVLDIISGGRVDLIVGAGYVRAECDMFGITLEQRVERLEEGIRVLRAAWSGEEFEYRGKQIKVTPRPGRGPALLLAGSTTGAAKRAARIADGFAPVDAALWPAYEAACKELGRTPIGLPPDNGPGFIHVAHDPDRAWAQIAPHALHETNAYAAWTAGTQGISVYTRFEDADALRASGRYAVLTPDECAELLRTSGTLRLHPLMGGLSPELAWESLELIANEVVPKAQS